MQRLLDKKQNATIIIGWGTHYNCSRNACLGDFNFDSSQTWGDWDHNHPKYPKEHLENNVLDEIMPNWVDVWPYLKGTKETGHTFDGATNVCVRNKKEIMRYDRIMVKIDTDFKLLVPHQIEMIGTESIDETGLMASDHYGLLVKLNVCTPLTWEKTEHKFEWPLATIIIQNELPRLQTPQGY